MSANLLEYIRDSELGANFCSQTPFGTRALIYADYTASGRALSFIEEFVRNHEREPHRWPLTIVFDEYEEMQWAWCEAWRAEYRRLRLRSPAGVVVTEEMLLEMAASRDEHGQRLLRPPTFDKDDPEGHYL